MRIPFLVAMIAASTLVIGACTRTGGASETEVGARPLVLHVEVRNNYPTAVSRQVFVSEPGSSPRRVGQVPASATRRLDVRAMDWDRQHVLYAESLTGGVIESAMFYVEPGQRVVWDLSSNRITIDG